MKIMQRYTLINLEDIERCGNAGILLACNMELIDIVPEFNLYQEFWRIYTNSETIKPQYMCENASIF